MAALKTISRSAMVAFSTSDDLVAVGTVSGSLDSSFTSSTFLEIYKLDFSHHGSDLPLVASCATSESVCRLSWSAPTPHYPSGLIAASLADGGINIWDPLLLLSDHEKGVESVPLANLETHQHRVQGLDFNPLSPQLLASGGADGAVHIWDVTDAANAKHFPPLESKDSDGTILCLAWNRKVSNIFATSYDGCCVVWDLKKQKSILKISDPSGPRKYSALQWHPEQATVLILAVEDDSAPNVQLWDLRHSTKFEELSGHTRGVLSLAWCPNDSSIFVSCGKDNRSLCWDVFDKGVDKGIDKGDFTGQVIGELHASGSWNFDVQWSPRLPGILSTSSFGGKIGIYNLEVANASVMSKAPKWLKTPVGTSFGFGGKLATFAAKTLPGSEKLLPAQIKIHVLSMEGDVVKCSDEFEAAVTGERKSHMKSFCDRKASEANSEQEREVWEFLKIMLEEDVGRKALLNQLGFQCAEKETIADDSSDIVADVSVSQVSQHTDDSAFQVIDDGGDFFENLEEPTAAMNGKHEEEEDPVVEDPVIEQQVIDETDETIEQALVVGNFRGAVEHCLSVNRMADALVIAYIGGIDLWEKTQNEYLKRNRRSYLQVVSAIATHDLTGLVENRPLQAWKETLALLGTYCRGEEWSSLVGSLASRLESAGNIQAATICYICAGNVEKTLEVSSLSFQKESQGKPAVSNLQDLVEKSIVLAIATDQRQTSNALASIVERYAEFLANQGLLDSATIYLSLLPGELSSSLAVLQDRIRRSGQVADAGNTHQQAIPEPSNRYFQPHQQQAPYPGPQQQQFPDYSGHRQFTPSPSLQFPQNPNQPPPNRFPSFPSQFPTPNQFPSSTPNQFTPSNQFSSTSNAFPTPSTQFPPPNAFTASTQFTPTPNAFTAPSTQFTPAPNAFTAPSTQFTPAPNAFTAPPTQFTPNAFPTAPNPSPFFPSPSLPPVNTSVPPPVRGFVPSPMIPRPAQTFTPAPFNPAASRPPPQQVIAPQPLISHLAPEPAAPPAALPTVQNVDTSNVKDELKPVVAALRRLFTETSDPSKKREVEDNSRKVGALLAKLNSGDVSPDTSDKLIQLAQALEGRNYPAAIDIQSVLTAKSWDECGLWLTAMRRMIKSRQALG